MKFFYFAVIMGLEFIFSVSVQTAFAGDSQGLIDPTSGMFHAVFPPKMEGHAINCHDGDTLVDSLGFTLEVQCKVSCRGKVKSSTTETISTETEFSKFSAGLREGDGNFLAPLTVGLLTVADRACLIGAASHCGRLAQVDTSEVTSLGSGAWRTGARLGCDKDQPRIVSPFDPKLKRLLRTIPPIQSVSNSEKLPEMTQLGRILPRGSDVSTQRLPLICMHQLSAQLCFGDCMDLKDSSQLLASSAPAGREEIQICADNFLNFAKGHPGLSRSVLKTYCRDFFWSSLRAASGAGTLSCAAARGQVECDQLFLEAAVKE